ncbi:unnamed protein product [Discosporangium mesarthrocarpum]
MTGGCFLTIESIGESDWLTARGGEIAISAEKMFRGGEKGALCPVACAPILCGRVFLSRVSVSEQLGVPLISSLITLCSFCFSMRAYFEAHHVYFCLCMLQRTHETFIYAPLQSTPYILFLCTLQSTKPTQCFKLHVTVSDLASQ